MWRGVLLFKVFGAAAGWIGVLLILSACYRAGGPRVWPQFFARLWFVVVCLSRAAACRKTRMWTCIEVSMAARALSGVLLTPQGFQSPRMAFAGARCGVVVDGSSFPGSQPFRMHVRESAVRPKCDVSTALHVLHGGLITQSCAWLSSCVGFCCQH